MQNTLLGLAIAIILALVVALVGPLVIDWGGQRSMFEVQATRLLGVDVRVKGAIDARLLPSPRLTLNDIEIGKSGPDAIHARSLGIEFALGPLMRGEWRASELTLAGPQVRIGLDAAGRVQAPALAVGFDADALSVDKLSIEDGKVTLADASNGAAVTFEKLWFNGDAKSLLGPFKGEGAVTIGNELYPFRLSSGRVTDDGAIKIHLNVDPVNRPLSIEADGLLKLAGGEPRFDGTWSLSKPVGIGLRTNARLTQPWRLSGKIKAGAQSALIEQIEYLYGSEERGLKLTGVADFKFGANARFDGVLSGRQIDLDRVLVAGDGTRPPPAAAIRELVELGGGAFRPSFPIAIGIGIDQITLGGNTVQNLRGDISSDATGWSLDRFEFRAPGYTQVRLSGHLAVGADGVAFTGPAEIEANDPKVLAAWLEGRSDVPVTPPIDLRTLRMSGDLTLGSEKIAFEKLRAEFDRKTISGRLSYVFAAGQSQAKLDAALNAPELDIDAALGFGPVRGGFGVAVVALEARLHDDPVASWNHGYILGGEAVVDLGLGDERGELAADGHEGLVAEQRAGAVAGGIDDGLLGQRGKIGGRVEFAGLEAAAGGEEIADEHPLVGGEVEDHVGRPAHEGHAERVAAGGQLFAGGREVLHEVLESAELHDLLLFAPATQLVERDGGGGVAVDPFDRLAGETEQVLVGPIGRAAHFLPKFGEGGRGLAGEADPGVRGPRARGPRGADLGRELFGVDGDAFAGALEEQGGGEAEGAATDDGVALLAGGDGVLERDGARTPRE